MGPHKILDEAQAYETKPELKPTRQSPNRLNYSINRLNESGNTFNKASYLISHNTIEDHLGFADKLAQALGSIVLPHVSPPVVFVLV